MRVYTPMPYSGRYRRHEHLWTTGHRLVYVLEGQFFFIFFMFFFVIIIQKDITTLLHHLHISDPCPCRMTRRQAALEAETRIALTRLDTQGRIQPRTATVPDKENQVEPTRRTKTRNRVRREQPGPFYARPVESRERPPFAWYI